MSTDQDIFQGHYTHGKPFVKARIVIVNPETGRQTTIEKNFWIDTGFDGGVHVAQAHLSEIQLIEVNPRLGPVGLAGGVNRPGYYCHAYLQQIGDYEFPAPGIDSMLILQGSSGHGFLGLEILRRFIATFDGPREFLKIGQAQQSQNREA